MKITFCDFISEEEILTVEMSSVPESRDIVNIPNENGFRFVQRKEWQLLPGYSDDHEVVVYLSNEKGANL